MNSRQRSVVIIAAVAIALMLLYPPFRFVARNGVEYNLGYSWLFAPPPISSSNATLGSVNLWLLLAQWAAVVLIAGALLFVLNDSSNRNAGPRPPDNKRSPSSRSGESPAAPLQFTVTVLRVLRAIVGFVGALQVMQLFEVISWAQNPDAVSGNMVAVALLKVVALTMLVAAFFGLRWLIHFLYIRGTGLPHPALLRRWAL